MHTFTDPFLSNILILYMYMYVHYTEPYTEKSINKGQALYLSEEEEGGGEGHGTTSQSIKNVHM